MHTEERKKKKGNKNSTTFAMKFIRKRVIDQGPRPVKTLYLI